jgi:predicted helicase
MLPIFDRPIKDWKDLQDKVAKIFSDQEFEVEIEKDLKTVHEVVNVDVFAKNPSVFPNEYYICECKFWNKPVSKNTIHAFRTVVSDFGANSGFIISKEGFQKGAYTAAENTNIHLMTWDESQDAFKERWLQESSWQRIG